ncbi:heavy metal sensor kinase [Silvibacterium bohemicum]|uniref:histidine kinase n=1 Tax=Silvibacterium bohemicum TaxID=1577686 RepID=A0A841JPS9_9BACT|nr:ATP-binding protein [Silvibacterium bohemicum]MBB6143150.1 heavy metal sensor kinase [Silvibacterium bohemicum]
MFATAAIMLSITSFYMLRHSLLATEDHELQERAEDVQLLLTQLGPEASPMLLRQKFAEIYKVKDDGKYLQVLDQEGAWIFRSKRMIESGLYPGPPAGLPHQGSVTQFHQGTRYVRALAYPIAANGRAYSVQTGLAMNKSMVLLSAFLTELLWLTPAVIVLAAAGGHFMARKALAPVAAIAVETRRINDRNLNIRLPISATSDEISQLSETLNQMLERVESGVRSIRDFTANAAHELRTPLALIRTEVEVALSMPRRGDEFREACEQVQLETVRMTTLIDSLLMLARVDAGTEALRFETLEGCEVLRRLAEKWKNAVRSAGLELEVELLTQPAFVVADHSSLQRLLTALLDNAIRYTPVGGSVVLRIARANGRVMFSVQDTGIGIAPEHQARIFDRFYRVDNIGGASRGSGLGLSLAQGIAQQHDALLCVESAAGRGSCFHFSLPEYLKPAATHERALTLAGVRS